MNDYSIKALAAAGTTRSALATGDTDGAVNRAYYAMLDAAKAAFEAVAPSLIEAKSHSAIIARFGERIVVARGLDRDLGRSLNSTEDLRIAADYDRKAVSREEAEVTIQRMKKFLLAVAALSHEPPP